MRDPQTDRLVPEPEKFPSGMKALSGTPADVIERVNPAQAAQVAALVTEMIRRS